jgi:predicted DNA-binding transcriptional regulator AlpA
MPRKHAVDAEHVLERPRVVADRLGVSLTTVWRMVRRGDLPKPIPLGPQSCAFRLSDIIHFIETRAAKRDRQLPRPNPNPRVGAGT